MILIKSAHRFARNTVDALKTIRMLRSQNIDIYFERENIHTLYESSQFMLMLVSVFAQDESYSQSEDMGPVQVIYEKSASGVSLARISAYLEDMEIPSSMGKTTWSKEILRKILNKDGGPPIVLYEYQANQEVKHAAKFQDGFSGYLHITSVSRSADSIQCCGSPFGLADLTLTLWLHFCDSYGFRFSEAYNLSPGGA